MAFRLDRWAPDPTIYTASTTLQNGVIYRYDTSGGAIQQIIPAASGFNPGDSFWIELVTADNTLTIQPTGGDTLDGSDGEIILSLAKSSVLFVRQSSTNWISLAREVSTAAFAQWTPVVASLSPHSAAMGELTLLPSAPFTVNLPTMSSISNGQSVIVKMNASDPDLVTVNPGGVGQTIEGASSFTFQSERGSAMFVAVFSALNWIVV